ncbi:hypothetical protein ES332_D09G020200v1 [Gossypium tomentosum]|uniref:Uncharacterized protein n=1 Tax=Gossypium tomentosum TaxID=34277 RepID=A0A5D2JBM5_GOSTO|nr:hypothetical protein ES332_D09G020200v1 [Gossypium tomentosum]
MDKSGPKSKNPEPENQRNDEKIAKRDCAFVPAASNVLQFKCMACAAKITTYSLEDLDVFRREFDFFDKVTSISGVLFPLPKEERRAGIRRLEMIGDKMFLLFK